MLLFVIYIIPLALVAAAVAGTFALALGLITTARILAAMITRRRLQLAPRAEFRHRWRNALRRYW